MDFEKGIDTVMKSGVFVERLSFVWVYILLGDKCKSFGQLEIVDHIHVVSK